MSIDPSVPTSPEQVPVPASATPGESAPDAATGPRLQIGTQRAGSVQPKAKAQIPTKAVEERPKQKVIVPNVRERFAPEIELAVAEAMGDLSFEAAMAAPEAKIAATLAPDTRVQATVVQIHNDDVFVDLGSKTQGVLSLQQCPESVEVGSQIDVIVDRLSNDEGLYLVRLPTGAVDVADWSELAEGMIVEARVTGHNKGGLECEVNNIRGFIPAGQVSPYRVEDLSTMVGEKFNCLVTECNPQRRILILSRRAVIEYEKAQAAEKMWAELEEGQVREGTVRSLQDFGAFVDLGGADGLIHISQMSWKRIRHPSDLLKLGDHVKVLVRKIDRDARKISLTLRDLTDNPWTNISSKFPVTSIVRGTVSRIMDFGAFVELEPGVEGLVHISELAHGRVFRVSDIVKEGDSIEAKVMTLDLEAQRIGLSMKAIQARPEAKKKEAPPEEEEAPLPPIVLKHKGPLKGGIERPKGGEQFGLKW